MSHLFSSYNSSFSSSSSSLVQLLDPTLLCSDSQAMPLTTTTNAATLLSTTNTTNNSNTSTVVPTTIHQSQPLRRSTRRLTQRLPSATTAASSSSPLSSPMSEESGSPLSPLPSSSTAINGDDSGLLSTANMTSHDLAKMIANAPQPNKQGKYECIVCHRAYTHKKHLRRHSMRHTGQKPYPCRYCYLRYMRCDTRNRHESTCKVKRALDHEEAEKRKHSVPSREIKSEPEDPVVQFIAEDTISSLSNYEHQQQQQHQNRPLVESPMVELLPPPSHSVVIPSSNFYFTSFNDKQQLVHSLPAHDDIINGALFDDANYSLSLDSVYPFETYQQPDYDSFFN